MNFLKVKVALPMKLPRSSCSAKKYHTFKLWCKEGLHGNVSELIGLETNVARLLVDCKSRLWSGVSLHLDGSLDMYKLSVSMEKGFA